MGIYTSQSDSGCSDHSNRAGGATSQPFVDPVGECAPLPKAVSPPGRVDAALRLGGLCLVGSAAYAICLLLDLVPQGHPRSATSWELILAALGFLGGSIGSALVILGAHINDHIEVSARWRVRSRADETMKT